ncbi:MAG TPA: TlpA disulfide reductase family protein, partial [Chitinophagaceae bacterium]|nr:TlpA disulfide reductase family protein [Chitinophagaceae bacterium]
PCRKENPIFIKIYNQFKKKKFTIIGISLDKDSTKWINAIKNDHLPWIQISDLKGHQSKVGYEYGINAIPANFLIGPHKEIIAVNLTAEELTVKLDSIFNKKR